MDGYSKMKDNPKSKLGTYILCGSSNFQFVKRLNIFSFKCQVLDRFQVVVSVTC